MSLTRVEANPNGITRSNLACTRHPDRHSRLIGRDGIDKGIGPELLDDRGCCCNARTFLHQRQVLRTDSQRNRSGARQSSTFRKFMAGLPMKLATKAFEG